MYFTHLKHSQKVEVELESSVLKVCEDCHHREVLLNVSGTSANHLQESTGWWSVWAHGRDFIYFLEANSH